MIGMVSKSTKYEILHFPQCTGGERRAVSAERSWSSIFWAAKRNQWQRSSTHQRHEEELAPPPSPASPWLSTAMHEPDIWHPKLTQRRGHRTSFYQWDLRGGSTARWQRRKTHDEEAVQPNEAARQPNSGQVRREVATHDREAPLSHSAAACLKPRSEPRQACWVYTGGVRAGHTCSWMTDGAERGGGPCTDEDGTQEAAADHWRRAASFCWSTEMLKLPSNELY